MSQKSSDDTLRRLLLGLVVSMYKFRGKTSQSGCETKRITLKELGNRFQKKLKASQSVRQVFYSTYDGRGETTSIGRDSSTGQDSSTRGEAVAQGEIVLHRARQ